MPAGSVGHHLTAEPSLARAKLNPLQVPAWGGSILTPGKRINVQKTGKKESKAAQIVIDKMLSRPERIAVEVTRAGDKAGIDEYIEQALNEIARRWPETVITRVQLKASTVMSGPSGCKRGGPAGTPEHQRIKIAREWLEVQGRVNQQVYAQTHGISAATLRRWIRQLRQTDKL